jgi:hypothetical protein
MEDLHDEPITPNKDWPFSLLMLYRLRYIEKYPSVYRRLLLASQRAFHAESTEEVNEVGLHCREILADYAKQVFSPDFTEEVIQEGNVKAMLKATINYYSKDRLRSVISSLLELVNKVVDYAHHVTHSYSVLPEEAKMCIDLCITFICAMESTVIIHAEKESHFYYHFGVLKCPRCKSLRLGGGTIIDETHDRLYYIIECIECGWSDWTE